VTRFKAPLALRAHRKANAKRYGQIVKEAFHEAWSEVNGIFISVTCFAAMSALMSNFGMTQTIAQGIVKALSGAPEVYALFIPVIGMLGSGLSGSTTTSNFMFARLQVQTAISLGLVRFASVDADPKNSVYRITAAQMLGSTAGEIISPMNAVVITLMEGVDLKESGLIMSVFPFAMAWLFFTMVTSLIFIAPNWAYG